MKSPGSPRIFYVGMVCTSSYVTAIKEDAFVGAASGKISSVVSALRLAGHNAVMVSLPFLGRGTRRQPSRLCRGDGFPALFLSVHRSSITRKVFGIITLACFALRRVRPSDTILFYNHAVEYLLALLILRFRGVSVFQDIEDMPISADRGMRGLLNRFGFNVMFALTSTRKVTVSNQVGNALHLSDFLAIQGVASETDAERCSEKWAQLEADAPLRVHYGGSLMVATGLDLFCTAIERLDAASRPNDKIIEFIVTGIGDVERIYDLASALRSDRLRIEVHQEVSRSAYLKLLNSCHVSLSLRSPVSEISCTTFPSKVIEITSHAIALIATRVSDVGDIFNDDEAWLLPHFTPQALTDILLEMARNPADVRRRADAGKAKARLRFSSLSVGSALAEFLKVGQKST